MTLDQQSSARQIPLPDNLWQVKLPVGQVDLNKVFFDILSKQMEEMHNYERWESEKFWIYMNVKPCIGSGDGLFSDNTKLLLS